MFDPIEVLHQYVSYPSVSTDPDFQEGMVGAQNFIANLLENIGLKTSILQTDRHPLVLAKREGDPSWPHVLIYGHYDVQPPDPIDQWTTAPFTPEIRQNRLYGRGAADNKGPQLAHITAVARLLKQDPNLPLRLTFLIEGEEEIGSPSLPSFLEKNREVLGADFVLLSDTQSPNPQQIVITTGLRGIVCVEAELTGPRIDLHSGIHGGGLLNPIQALSELCASLHDPDGRVTIKEFYESVLPISDWERGQIAKLEQSPQAYADFLGIKDFHVPDGMSPFESTRLMPTLDFNGITGGYQGVGAKTIIPSKASVKISCRLVPDMDPKVIQEKLINTLRERCSPKVKLNLRTGHCAAPYSILPPQYPVLSSDLSPILKKAFYATESAITECFGKKPLFLREGGSVPIISDIKTILGLDSLMIGLFTPECNLHAPDESMHLGLLEKGIDVSERLLRAISR